MCPCNGCTNLVSSKYSSEDSISCTYQLLYLQRLFIFVFKNLLTQKKVGKLMVRKTFFKKWQQALLKTLLQKLPLGMILQTLKQLYTMKVKPHFHEMIDGFPCPGRDNGYSWRISWGYFSSLPRGSCLVASSSEKSRLEQRRCQPCALI